MNLNIEPIRTESLKEVFINRFEDLIFSGKLAIGQQLPSERELAQQLGVSRPVVHEGLVELKSKGLVSMKPRVGAVVNDYRRQGSPALLSSLLNYRNGLLDPKLLDSVLAMRMLLELETARLAAENRTVEQLAEIESVIEQEKNADREDIDAATRIDFEFHHAIAIASDNLIYPLVLNSFKSFYTSLSRQFFKTPGVMAYVFERHTGLAAAIRDRDVPKAVSLMKALIEHGAETLKQSIRQADN